MGTGDNGSHRRAAWSSVREEGVISVDTAREGNHFICEIPRVVSSDLRAGLIYKNIS